ncbi:MAG TPA: hypothetical protein VNN08_16050 [Thermoanaerobaculia bacterium]|nr:hypothetical protein [Thermoanaerobaculia bacterium]
MGSAAVVLCLLAATLALGVEARSPSDAERAAVSVVADYLVRGPQAVLDQLASTSPLRRLPASDALAEIEARLGPPAGARWELQTVVPALKDKRAAFAVAFPSGVDDDIFFDLVNEGGAIRVLNVRTLAEPSDAAPLFSTPSVTTSPVSTASGSGLKPIDFATLGLIVVGVLTLLGLGLLPRAAAGGRVALLIGMAAGCGTVGFAVWTSFLVMPEVKASHAVEKQGLRDLVGLRRAVAAGGDGVSAALAAAPSSGEAAKVAALWKAQNDLVQMRLDDVKMTLSRYPQPSNVPLVELLRARLALVENDSFRAVAAYQNAINIGPGRDGLWIEAAEAFLSGGYEDLGKQMMHRAAGIGSRNAVIYYRRAVEDLVGDHLAESDVQFKEAWTMLPLQRRHLVGTGLLSMMVRQQDNNALVSLSTPDEATFAAPDVSTRAITLPPGTIARVSGQMFEIAIGDGGLIVPGGAAMAPVNVTVVDAGAWERIGEEKALANVAGLIKDAATPGAYMQPVLRGRILRAAQALSNRNRWSDVAALTAGISLKWQFIDTRVVLLRAEALRRLAREQEAKQVVVDLATSQVVARRNNAATYEEIGEALSSYDEFDSAIGMFSKAKALQAGDQFDTMRIEQVAMNRALAKRYSVYESPHFHVRYPGGSIVGNAVAISKVLEAELTRLQRWVPVENFKPVVVNIVPWNEFRTIYAQGGDILGFYDRAITVPLAEINRLEPEITAIVTHELCHALIAQATHDQAPHWFHEGLAQRVEMIPYSPNAFNMYDDKKLFALSVLDPILTQARDGGMIVDAYIVSETFIRYLESTYGDRAIKQLLAAFATGATTDEALQQLTGTTAAAVDTNFRKWGRSESRVFQNPPPILYQLAGENLVQVAEPAEPPKRLQGGALHRGSKEQP